MMRVHPTVIEAKPFRIRCPEQFRILTCGRGTRITLLEEIDHSFARGEVNKFRCIPADVPPFLVWRNRGLLFCRRWGLLRIGKNTSNRARDDDQNSAEVSHCRFAPSSTSFCDIEYGFRIFQLPPSSNLIVKRRLAVKPSPISGLSPRAITCRREAYIRAVLESSQLITFGVRQTDRRDSFCLDKVSSDKPFRFNCAAMASCNISEILSSGDPSAFHSSPLHW